MSLLAATAIADDTEDWGPEQFLFEGRLVGFSFAPHQEAGYRLVLHFQVIQRIAMVSQQTMTRLTTNHHVDLDGLDADDFLAQIQDHLPEGVHIGGRCLVTMSHTGATGYELVECLPATNEARENWLTHHRDFLDRFDAYIERAHLTGRMAHLRSLHQRVQTAQQQLAEVRATEGDAETIAFHTRWLEQAQAEWQTNRQAFIERLHAFRTELKAAIEASLDDPIRLRLEARLKRIESTLEKLTE